MPPSSEKDEKVAWRDEPASQNSADADDAPAPLKLDAHGLPLVPQPSDHKDDPLNWPQWYKYFVVSLLCLLAFAVQFGAGMVPAAFHVIAEDLGVTEQQASFLTTSYTLLGGVTPLLLTPFVNLYGRRVAYLAFTLLSLASNIGSGFAPTYSGLITSRCFAGVGSSVALAIGGATICDLFFQGERGRFIGFYALAITNGPHFGPIAGGFISLNIGYRWIFFVNAIMMGALLAIFLVAFPETLYSRVDFNKLEDQSYWQRLTFRGKVLDRKLTLSDFTTNFKMLKYWAITIPCVYYMTTNTYGSISFVLTAPHLAAKLYNFNTGQTGVFIGVPLTVGCLIGECFTGWISDKLINRYAAKHNGYRKPEVRLHLVFLSIFLPVGLIIYGVGVDQKLHWIALAMGMGIASVGVQAGTTLTYSYCSDCYKPQAAEVSTIINLFRQIFAFTVGFYALPFGEGHGFGVAWGTFAAINTVTWLGLLLLIWKGKEIREKQGVPNDHKDI